MPSGRLPRPAAIIWFRSPRKERGRRASLLSRAAKQVSAALGSRPPVIKRADLGAKGVYYRTMVGPFGSTEEAAQFYAI